MAWVTCAYVARRRDQGGPRPLSCIVSKQLQAGCTGGPSACASPPPFWYVQSIAGGGGAPPRHRSVGSNGRGGHGRPAPRPAQPAPGGAQPTPSRATGLQGHPRPTRFNPSWGRQTTSFILGARNLMKHFLARRGNPPKSCYFVSRSRSLQQKPL